MFFRQIQIFASALLTGLSLLQVEALAEEEPSAVGARDAWCISQSATDDWGSSIPGNCKFKVIDSSYKQIIIWLEASEVFRNGKIERDLRGPAYWLVLTGSCLRPDCAFTNNVYPDRVNRLLYYSPSRILVEIGGRMWILPK